MARLLFLSDTHLGFDFVARPRVKRRRRSEDFERAYHQALRPAFAGEVDAVIHGGDVFHHPRVPASLVQTAMAPLFELADGGMPVVMALGNHERSRMPYPLLAAHPRVHLIDRPRTVRLSLSGLTVAVAGFPFIRRLNQGGFERAVEATDWPKVKADVRLLLMHQSVEGARVGVQNYTFRPARDVVAAEQLPLGFHAYLSGHIHRHQVLTHALNGRSFPAPLIYPGATCRTAMQERLETKGACILTLDWQGVSSSFRPHYNRPMHTLELATPREDTIADALAQLDPNAIVRLRFAHGRPPSAARLRQLAPFTMNVDLPRPPVERR